MSKPRIIAVLNQKGGVGKTTITTNLVHGIARKGYEVLAIDLDPQAQLTTSLGMAQRDLKGMDECLLEEVSLSDVSHPVRANLELIPAGSELSEVERLAEGGVSRGMLLKNALNNHIDKYDYVLIDCPPSSGLLVVNAIFATQEVLIPMTGDYLALQGLSHLMTTLKNFEQALGHELKQWLVLSRFQARRRLSQEVRDSLIKHFPDKVLVTEISESVVLAESPSYGETIFEYKPSSKSAAEYESLVDDLIIGRTH